VPPPPSCSPPSRRTRSTGFGVRTGVSVDPDQFYFGAHADVRAAREEPLVPAQHRDRSRRRRDADRAECRARVLVPVEEQLAPLRGRRPGLNIYDHDNGSDTQAGLNFLLGVAHRGGFFVEAKVGAFDSPNLKFGFGYTF
jgi:hypothetical protein